LTALPKLQALELDHTAITDHGLRALSGITSLKRLELNQNPGITDVGIAELSKIKNLQWVDLWKCKVTSQGLNRLKDSLPTTSIAY
jgi:hypothetical protein